jgi:outer membrane protein insertion porin family
VLKDLAVCTGLGLRLDFSYAVIRVDAGYPIKRPGLNNGYGFQLSQLNYWKDANFVIGFGYPF